LLPALANWQPEAVMSGLDVLVTTKTRLRFTGHGQVLMELAVIRLSRLADMLPLAEVAKRLDGLAKGASRGRPVPTASRITSEANVMANPPQPVVESFRVSINGEIKPAAPENLSVDRLPELWQAVLGSFASTSPHRAMLEKSTAQCFVPPNGLLVSFPRNCQDAKEFSAESSRCSRLEEVLKKLTGQTVLVRFELGQEEFVPEKSIPKAQMMKQTLQQVPLAKALMEHLGAQVVDMDEGFGAVLDNTLSRVE
jgi:DNA polymerase-3 subunit gamma/tau